MSEQTLIKLLKTSISIGLCLLLLGIYLHNFNEYMETLGVTGIIISAVCIAFGLIFSLPTKMFLTFVLVKREAEQQAEEKERILISQNTTMQTAQKNLEQSN